MKKILVTTDFSANSKAGTRFAIQLQSQFSSELIVYHCIEISKPTSWSPAQFKKIANERVNEKMNELKTFVTRTYTQMGLKPLKCIYTVEVGTNVDAGIVSCAKKLKVDAICMATRGAGKIMKIVGTNTSHLIAKSPLPVIVVPRHYRAKPVTTLFYASDFISLDKELKHIRSFFKPLKLNVQVFHYDYSLHVQENLNKLNKKIRAHRVPGVTFHVKHIDLDTPLSARINKDISWQKPSLAAIFTRPNRSWVSRLFLSSEAANLSFDIKVPMFVFRKTR